VADPAARHPHNQPAAVHPRRARAVPHLRRLIDQLVERRIHIVGELHLRHGTQPLRGGAHGEPDDALLRQRRVEDARAAEVAREVRRAAEHAAKGHVLAEEQHAVVGGERGAQGGVDGFVQRLGRRLGARAHGGVEFRVRERRGRRVVQQRGRAEVGRLVKRGGGGGRGVPPPGHGVVGTAREREEAAGCGAEVDWRHCWGN
jgi:hypothetical protein